MMGATFSQLTIKIKVFWNFQRVQNGNIGQIWVKEQILGILLIMWVYIFQNQLQKH